MRVDNSCVTKGVLVNSGCPSYFYTRILPNVIEDGAARRPDRDSMATTPRCMKRS
jgi:hypothetical protein